MTAAKLGLVILLVFGAPIVSSRAENSDAQIAAEKEAIQATRAAGDETVRLDDWLIRLGMVQAAIFLLQLAAFIYQGRKLRDTVETARQQAQDFRASIDHSARGANAMETVAQALLSNTQIATQLLTLQRDAFRKQLRAYLSLQLQSHIPENVERNFRHEVQLSVKNVGHTPAHGIVVSGRLRVLQYPPTPQTDFSFSAGAYETRGHLVPQDSCYVRLWLEGFLSADENVAIRTRSGLALYVFGKVTYKDIFDDSWYTNFCYVIQWDSNSQVLWESVPGRNDAI